MQNHVLAVACLSLWTPSVFGTEPAVSLTLVPPSPVTEQSAVDVRAAVRNGGDRTDAGEVAFYLDEEAPAKLLHRERVEVPARSARAVTFRWPAKGSVGRHRMILVANVGAQTMRAERPLEVLASDVRSPRRIDGAWIMFDVLDGAGGSPVLAASRKLTDAQWAEMVRGMHAIGMDVIVVECVFDNFACKPGQHQIDRDGYRGKPYYPSRLFPGPSPLAAANPVEAVLAEADRLGMHVFLGVGWYVWGEYTPAALDWHKRVSSELYETFGHHPSFYGWYVAGESTGDLGSSPQKQREIVDFFREFQAHCRRMTPDKPIMLAPGCDYIPKAADTWRQLVRYCDIVCPFGFHRMPADDVPPEESVRLLQTICDEAGAHLWFDLETFVFDRDGGGLIPRTIDAIVDDLHRYPTFEKVLCFQFMGLLNAPDASTQVGGPPTVTLYKNYQAYLQHGLDYRQHVDPATLRKPVKHVAVGKPVVYASFPSPRYPGGGRGGLTDGFQAERKAPYYEDLNWQGFWGVDLDVTIDLGQPTPLTVLRSDYLQRVGSGIYLPARVQYAVSDDGRQFRTVATLEHDTPTKQPWPLVRSFEAKLTGVTARHIRVHAASVRTIPAGLPAAGQKAWLFVDEIVVNPVE